MENANYLEMLAKATRDSNAAHDVNSELLEDITLTESLQQYIVAQERYEIVDNRAEPHANSVSDGASANHGGVQSITKDRLAQAKDGDLAVADNAAIGAGSSAVRKESVQQTIASTSGGQADALNESVVQSRKTLAEEMRSGADCVERSALQSKVDRLIWSYRYYGYLMARINPLGEYITPELKYLFYTIEGIDNFLNIEEHGISEAELDIEVKSGRYIKPESMPLRELIALLQRIYCSGMSLETLHIQNRNMRRWILGKVEHISQTDFFNQQLHQRIQKDLIKAEEFEQFVHSNFVGQKRFSLEGGEVLIPALRYLCDEAVNHKISDIVVGMPHRGRLNVFTNALRKKAADTFSDFIGSYQPHEQGGSGDVKYHLGHNFTISLPGGKSLHVSLVANPSHLEAVDPVVQGKCRAIQRRKNDRQRKHVVPILIHGDAAFSGQGIVSEVFNLSQLKGYKTGGTIHIIVNNQIGFTTSSRDARSTFFCSDAAKLLPIPIFHVNGDDPEAVIRSIHLAILYRQKFSFDVVIDIVCYRRLGHNEADDPSFTHPMMYKIINSHKSVRTLFGEQLAAKNVFSMREQDEFATKYRNVLKQELDSVHNGYTPNLNDAFQIGSWKEFRDTYSFDVVDTSVPLRSLQQMADKLTQVPVDFSINSKVERIVKARKNALDTEKSIDWSFAEHLAFGSLLQDGYSIRLSGEDCARGTFSQRHTIWWDTTAQTPHPYTPIKSLETDLAVFSVYDSPLSEFGVLGFEYGYTLAQPNMLVIWEAQFGDFVNGAQVIIDQFIVAAQRKWHRCTGLVMLLPHAYEGQGPEHSSAHLERFLQLCAEDNIQVVNASTPAQYFHLLRRQMLQRFRLPLIVMSPKSLLRNKLCRSSADELSSGHFQVIIDDDTINPSQIERIVLCSGHHYYDLLNEREKRQDHKTSLIRLEQFYPFPKAAIHTVLAHYSKSATVIWSQEESRNRGAFHFLWEGLSEILKDLGYAPLKVTSRPESASPATGSFSQHKSELEAVLNKVFE